MGGKGSGRRPRPTALKVLEGERRDRINSAEPVPAEGPVEPPADLSAEGLAVWESLAGDLIDKGVLTTWDVHAFALYCDAVALNDQARAERERTGPVIRSTLRDRHGNVVGEKLEKNPWVTIWRESADVMQRLGARFALTPSDRSQVKVPGASEHGSDDAAADILS